jgi:phosphoglycolate phosphatase
MYQNVLFDLDGTLTDPGLGITNSVAHALRRWGIQAPERSELYKFIGPPLADSFERFYGFSRADAEKSVEYYREYFRDKGIYENALYPGAEELLRKLKDSGRMVVLATSKPEEFAKRILGYFHIEKYFDFVAGASMDGSLIKKGDVIAYALKSAHVTDLKGTVMVGDREHDIIGANENGIDSIGVLFGYGDLAELKGAGATYIAGSVDEIFSFV